MSATLTHGLNLPLLEDSTAYWDELKSECQRLVQAVNTLAVKHGLHNGHLVEWIPGREIRFERKMYPSTEVAAGLSQERWGPLIKVSISGHQHEDLRFYPEEHEVPLARDLDGRVVAVFGEGRSYSARELACYLVQRFRRCFPEMALPCMPNCEID